MSAGLPGIKKRIMQIRWDREEQLRRLVALFSGPPYKPDHRRIVIDITNACNLSCFDCNRSCGQGQAMSVEHISLGQIRLFIQESAEQVRKWKEILIEGGEPTLHPDLLGIVELLLEYKRVHSPRTQIQVNSNGFDPSADRVLAKLPREIQVYKSQKETPRQEHHLAFNVAPVDLADYEDDPFSNGCFLPARYGIGLLRYGYYAHPVCGNIDRVFGFDVGRKTLPSPDDPMADQMQTLCRYCGHYRDCNPKRTLRRRKPAGEATMSPAWIKAYADYRRRKPILTLL